MFERRNPLPLKEQEDMTRWLSILAQQTGSEKFFLIESMQPQDWLINSAERWIYRISFGLAIACIAGLVLGLRSGLKFGVISGLFFGIFGGLFFQLNNINLVESIKLSRLGNTRHRHAFWGSLKSGLITGLATGYSGGLIAGLIISFKVGLISGLTIGLIFGSFVGLLVGIIIGLKSDIEMRSYPNQGIWKSLKNSIIIMLCFALPLAIFLSYIFPRILPLFVEPRLIKDLSGVLSLLPFWIGLFAGGGVACIQHFALRLVLFQSKRIPWNFVTFFKEAEARLFIQQTDGGCIFVHRYLQEYFASLAPIE